MNRLFIMGSYTDEIERYLQDFSAANLQPFAGVRFITDIPHDLDFLRNTQANRQICGLAWDGCNYGILVRPDVGITDQICHALLISVDGIQHPYLQWKKLTLQRGPQGQIHIVSNWQ